MLYGMDDQEEYEEQEYGLIKQEKLNIKKVILFIAIVIGCFVVVFGSFYVSFKNLNNNSENLIAEENKIVTENNTDKNDKAVQTDKVDKEKKKTNKDVIEKNIIQNGLDYYKGEHIEIPVHDTEKIMEKFVPQANPNGQQQIKDIYFSEEKQVYLTFDDGPSKDVTPQVLDILKQYDVKATFFVLGARVDLYPQTLRRIFEEGHYIANHGYSHKYSQIYESKDTIFQEYVECENSIKTALNNQDYNSYLFRFPGGSTGGRYSKIKAEGRDLLNSYGIAYTNWNCLNGDAEGKETKEECIAEFIYTKGNQNSLIVLMHDANDKQQTIDSLPDIIQYLKNEGYTFKNFYEIF